MYIYSIKTLCMCIYAYVNVWEIAQTFPKSYYEVSRKSKDGNKNDFSRRAQISEQDTK